MDGLLARREEYRAHITALLERNIFDIGDAARGGGDYLIARVKEIEYLRAVGKDPAVYARPSILEAQSKASSGRSAKKSAKRRQAAKMEEAPKDTE